MCSGRTERGCCKKSCLCEEGEGTEVMPSNTAGLETGSEGSHSQKLLGALKPRLRVQAGGKGNCSRIREKLRVRIPGQPFDHILCLYIKNRRMENKQEGFKALIYNYNI